MAGRQDKGRQKKGRQRKRRQAEGRAGKGRRAGSQRRGSGLRRSGAAGPSGGAVPWPHGPRCRICVSLAEPAPDALLRRLDEAAEGGAELVEVRLDALQLVHDLSDDLLDELVAHSSVPVGFTLRPAWQGGGFEGEEAERRDILARAARAAQAGNGFVDVELDADWAADFVAASPAAVVLSHHWDDEGVPSDLHERAAQARAIAPALVKLVATAAAPDDASPLLRVGAALIADGQPATCFCMGAAGRASRLLAAVHGGALIYAAAAGGREVAPGQWPLDVLVDELGVQHWQEGAEVFGLIGDPIGHSLSPVIFNAVFRQRGVARAYLPLEGDDLDAVLRLAEAAGVRGVSVTMPFKQDMAERSMHRARLVEATGAANTVLLDPDGWHAYNTDGRAVVEVLEEVRPIAGARIAVVGAGGAGLAAAAALNEAQADVTVLNRTPKRAKQVAETAGAAWGAIHVLEEERFAVVINATPVGMTGTEHAEETPFPLDWLAGDEVVFDMVYRPRRTPLLRGAAARGCTTIEGLEMFVRQAAAQYRLLTGDREHAPLALMRETAGRILDKDEPAAHDSAAGGTE